DFRTQGVRSSQYHFPQPRHCKQYATVLCARHQQSVVTRQKVAIHHQMHALARSDHGLCRLTRGLVVHSTQIVYPHSGSVHHATRLDLRLDAGIHGAISRTHHLTVSMKQTDHGAIVDQQAALGGGATSKRQGQARVVELAVPVLHPALQSLAAHAGQAIQSLTTRKKLSGSQTGAPRQGIVSLEADAIERCLPALVARHDEWNGAGNVRRVVQKLAAFVQGFAYQRDIALSEITYAAMY